MILTDTLVDIRSSPLLAAAVSYSLQSLPLASFLFNLKIQMNVESWIWRVMLIVMVMN